MYGWAGQRLKVYLSEGKIVKEKLSEEFVTDFLGGRGFNSKTLYDEIGPDVDAMSPDNIFMVGIGPLAGTLAPGTARWTVSTLSPVTGILADGNGGGHFAPELKFAGYDQIVVYGRSPKPVYLWINDDQVELRDASHLWGKTVWETHDLLAQELGDSEVQELSVGPAAENLVRFAKVYGNMTRVGGKSGVGTVMGAKQLKAIAVRGTNPVKIAKPEEFYGAVKDAHKKLLTERFPLMLREQGTMFHSRLSSMKRAITVRNSQEGYLEGWETLTWEAFEEQFAVKHGGCFSCPISCCHYYEVKDGPYKAHGFANQWGTLYPFTYKLGSNNLAASLKLTTICDQLGLDTHGFGATVAFAMEAWQRGLLTAKDTDGIDLSWGNIDSAIKLAPMVAYRQGFGDILAEGTVRASKQIKGSEACLVTTKDLECSSLFPGEDDSKVNALAFATAPIGGTNHRGGFCRLEAHPRVQKALGMEVWKKLIDPQNYEGAGVVLMAEQDFVAALNGVEGCLLFGGGGDRGLNWDDFARLMSTATGLEMDGDAFMKAGERIFNIEKVFNIRRGIRRKDDTLPARFFVEEVTPFGTKGVNYAKFQAMLDEYYRVRGWDQEGIPTREKLEELNLGYAVEEMAQAAGGQGILTGSAPASPAL